MYIEVRKVANKTKVSGKPKRIEPIETKDFKGNPIYSYKMSDECFERPDNITYKFIAKHSYREDGKVKSKSAYIYSFTVDEVIDGWCDLEIYECCKENIKEKLGVDNSQLEELLTLFYEKADKIMEEIENTFDKSEEGITKVKNDAILQEYKQKLAEFDKKYGNGNYQRVYDFNGKLRNPTLLKQFEDDLRAREEYERESRRQQREQWDNFYKNYSGSNQLGTGQGAYSDDEKAMLKKFYRALSQKFHPDCATGSNEAMALVNKLKQQWNV